MPSIERTKESIIMCWTLSELGQLSVISDTYSMQWFLPRLSLCLFLSDRYRHAHVHIMYFTVLNYSVALRKPVTAGDTGSRKPKGPQLAKYV
jgi:hypothetical protein